jgi:transcriptional regulator with XRE-family HTH domain
VNETDWPAYLSALSTNQSEIARAADVHSGTVSRWFSRSSHPLAPQVIAVARAFGQSPVIALLAAGYLTRDEVEGAVTLSPGMTLAEFSELDIAQELVRRIEAGEATELSEAPLEVDHPAWANVGGGPQDEATEGSPVEIARRNFERELERAGLTYEDLGYAAKTDAREVEEDQHTP